MKRFAIAAILLLVIGQASRAGVVPIGEMYDVSKGMQQDTIPTQGCNYKKNFLGIAPLGILLSRPRLQYERQPGKFGIGGIYTRYNDVWKGDKIEPFVRLYLNPKSKLKLFLHLQAGIGVYRIPYTKETTTGATIKVEYPNYDIKEHVMSYGTGIGLGAKLINRKNFFFDVCIRGQHYELASTTSRTVEKEGVTSTYYPSRGNGFFRVTGPGAAWVSSFVIGWRL